MKKLFPAAVVAVLVTGTIYVGVWFWFAVSIKTWIGSGGGADDPRRWPELSICACVTTVVFALVLLVRKRRDTELIGAAAAMSALASVGIALTAANAMLEEPLVMSLGSTWYGGPTASSLAIFGLVGLAVGGGSFLLVQRAARIARAPMIAVGVAALTVATALASTRRPEPRDFRTLLEHHDLPEGVRVPVGPMAFERHGASVIRALPDGVSDELLFPTDARPLPLASIDRDPITGLVVGRLETEMASVGPDYADPIVSARGDKVYWAVVISDFPHRLGAPRGWLWGGIVGLGLAAAALAMAVATERRANRFLAALQRAEHSAGWVKVDQHAPIFVDALAKERPGPVMVRLRARGGGSYREMNAADIVDVAPGDAATVRAEARAWPLAWAWVSIGAALATAAPLWAAGWQGLLW